MITSTPRQPLWELMGLLFRAHPWHGDYFETYKQAPGAIERPCEITHVYGRDEAYDVIRRAQADYHERFGALESLLDAALHG